MIGSRLPFSAYGRVGPWARARGWARRASCLLVLDEPHLCSRFAATLVVVDRRVGTVAWASRMRGTAVPHPVGLLGRGLSTGRGEYLVLLCASDPICHSPGVFGSVGDVRPGDRSRTSKEGHHPWTCFPPGVKL
jgi:hypothetical protein